MLRKRSHKLKDGLIRPSPPKLVGQMLNLVFSYMFWLDISIVVPEDVVLEVVEWSDLILLIGNGIISSY